MAVRPSWFDCLGPIMTESGPMCRWVDQEPDCVACRAAAEQAAWDAADEWYDRMEDEYEG